MVIGEAELNVQLAFLKGFPIRIVNRDQLIIILLRGFHLMYVLKRVELLNLANQIELQPLFFWH